MKRRRTSAATTLVRKEKGKLPERAGHAQMVEKRGSTAVTSKVAKKNTSISLIRRKTLEKS